MAFEIKKDETGTEYLEDEERDIVFRENDCTRRGEVGEGFYMEYGFDLIWKGHTCKVAAHEENISNRFELRDWNVHIYVIPPELRTEKETIKQILSEAFEILGFNFDPEYRTRDVTFSVEGGLEHG